MTLKQFVVIIIPPLLTFVFFLVRQPRTKKQRLYQKAQANGWYVEAKAIKWHYSTKTTDDMSDYSKIFVTYEYTINGHKQKKRFVYRNDGDDFPTQLKVYYLNNDPKKAVFENEIEDLNFSPFYTTLKKGCGWGFIVFIIWGILVLNMLNI